jgi:hypothetical protein
MKVSTPSLCLSPSNSVSHSPTHAAFHPFVQILSSEHLCCSCYTDNMWAIGGEGGVCAGHCGACLRS